jgi:hypothetical protein
MMRDDFYNKYGRSLENRISFLLHSLEGDELLKARPWADIFNKTKGSSMNFSSNPFENQKAEDAKRKNNEALRELEKIFFEKFGEHMVENKHTLGLSDEDNWPSDEA